MRNACQTTGGSTGRLLRGLLVSAIALLFFPIGPAGADPANGERVTVYYFHSTLRCETCLLIEAQADVTLRAEFADELSNGTLVWRPLDMHLTENKHFITDFSLGANDLVVLREKAGENPSWEKIPELWELAADPELLSHRLRAVIARFLGKNN